MLNLSGINFRNQVAQLSHTKSRFRMVHYLTRQYIVTRGFFVIVNVRVLPANLIDLY